MNSDIYEKGLKMVSVRLVKEPSLYPERKIRTADDVKKFMRDELSSFDREVFCVLNLAANGKVINMNIASVGTLSAAMVSPREIFKSSILSNAGSVILYHNHPSGSVQPSLEDYQTTKRLAKAGMLLDIKVLDHIIVAGRTGEMYSFAANGEMEQYNQLGKEENAR